MEPKLYYILYCNWTKSVWVSTKTSNTKRSCGTDETPILAQVARDAACLKPRLGPLCTAVDRDDRPGDNGDNNETVPGPGPRSVSDPCGIRVVVFQFVLQSLSACIANCTHRHAGVDIKHVLIRLNIFLTFHAWLTLTRVSPRQGGVRAVASGKPLHMFSWSIRRPIRYSTGKCQQEVIPKWIN